MCVCVRDVFMYFADFEFPIMDILKFTEISFSLLFL